MPAEGGARPQGEGLRVAVGRVGVSALFHCRLGVLDQPGEVHRVDRVTLGSEDVTGVGGDDDVLGDALGLEGLAQGGDHDRDLGTGGGGRATVPDSVDEGVDRHDPAGVEQQQSQDRSLARTADGERTAVRRHRQGPKDLETDPLTHGCSPRTPPTVLTGAPGRQYLSGRAGSLVFSGRP